MLHCDFETRSFCNLLINGGYNYAMHPTTQATMLAFVFDEDPDPEIWIPLEGAFWDALRAALADNGYIVHKHFPQSIIHYIKGGGMIAAHNAQFERLIFDYIVCPDFNVENIPLESWYCTATQARVNNMPATLEGCAQALGGEQQKDFRGKNLIQILCIPHENKETGEMEFVEDLESYIEFAEYCIQDVRTERSISNAMRALTDAELDDYVASEIVNDAGLLIDRELAEAAVQYADTEQLECMLEIYRLTDNTIDKCRGKRLTNWVFVRLDDDQQKHMYKYKNGELKLTLDRNARERILLDPSIAQTVRDVVEFSDFAQASSTGKFKAMTHRADSEDDRVRGAYIFSGAASTGRYSSRGLQLHNFPRDALKDPDAVADMVCDGYTVDSIEKAAGHSLMQTLKRLLRHSIVADDGYTFVCGDWGQVEGRMLPWLSIGTSPATDVFAQQKLDAYANQTHENDVYCQTASQIFNRKILRDGGKDAEADRQIGKVAELSLGFGGGIGAFQSMAVNYGVHVTDERADEIKFAWRAANPWAQPFWNALHKAACTAVRTPGYTFSAGRVQFMYHPDLLMGALLCLLPSGRLLTYPKARCEMADGKYGPQWQLSALKSNWKPKADEKEWPRVALWPGLIAENVTQAECATLLRQAITRLVFDHNAPLVGHTHDELLLEVREAETDYWRDLLNSVMLNSEDWAKGLPLDADIWTGPNFRK
jgi:DNA polymerase